MTAKEHMQQFHKGLASHHRFLAGNETEKAAHHNALAEAHDELDQADLAKIHRKCAKVCEAAAAEHAERSAAHTDMAKAVSAADLTKADLDLDRIRPDGVQGVITHFGVTPHPRAGAPDIAKTVDPQFAHLYEIEE